MLAAALNCTRVAPGHARVIWSHIRNLYPEGTLGYPESTLEYTESTNMWVLQGYPGNRREPGLSLAARTVSTVGQYPA